MGDKKKGTRFGSFFKSGSASSSGGQNLAKDSPGGAASGQSQSEPEQSWGEQRSRRASLAPSSTSDLLNWFKRRSPSPSRSPGGKHRPKAPDPLIATPSPVVSGGVFARPHSSYYGSSAQSPTAPASMPARPHSSYSSSSALQMHGYVISLPTAAGGSETVVPSDGHGSPSSGAQGSSTMFVSTPIIQISHPQSEAIASKDTEPHLTGSPHISTSNCQVQAWAEIDVALRQTKPAQSPVPGPAPKDPSSQVWAKALEIAKKKLSDKMLPPLDLKNLPSQSAKENVPRAEYCTGG